MLMATTAITPHLLSMLADLAARGETPRLPWPAITPKATPSRTRCRSASPCWLSWSRAWPIWGSGPASMSTGGNGDHEEPRPVSHPAGARAARCSRADRLQPGWQWSGRHGTRPVDRRRGERLPGDDPRLREEIRDPGRLHGNTRRRRRAGQRPERRESPRPGGAGHAGRTGPGRDRRDAGPHRRSAGPDDDGQAVRARLAEAHAGRRAVRYKPLLRDHRQGGAEECHLVRTSPVSNP